MTSAVRQAAAGRPGFDRLSLRCAGRFVPAVGRLAACPQRRDWHHARAVRTGRRAPSSIPTASMIRVDRTTDCYRHEVASAVELGVSLSHARSSTVRPSRRPAHHVPIGYIGTGRSGWDLIELRVQEASSCIQRFRQLVALASTATLAAEQMHFRAHRRQTLVSLMEPVRYRNIISILKNPSTPAHCYGKSESVPRSSRRVRTTSIASL